MKLLVSAYIVVACCVAASLQYTPHARCADGPPPKQLRVQGCTTSTCRIRKGANLIAEWDFVANRDASALKPRVKVRAMGITIDYDYPEPNACKSLKKGRCPLKKGDKATYSLQMPISKSWPSVSAKVEFALVDENKNVQVCFRVNGRLARKFLVSSIEEDEDEDEDKDEDEDEDEDENSLQ